MKQRLPPILAAAANTLTKYCLSVVTEHKDAVIHSANICRLFVPDTVLGARMTTNKMDKSLLSWTLQPRFQYLQTALGWVANMIYSFSLVHAAKVTWMTVGNLL